MNSTRQNIISTFWNGIYKDKQYCFNEEGIKIAIKRAIADFTFRTERRAVNKTVGIEGIFERISDETNTADTFVKKFIDYFLNDDIRKTQKDFDSWHDKQCERFLTALMPIYPQLAYGKAQKIVNMTFKNAFCLPNGEKVNDEEMYTYCHMPLDSFTLEWFARNISKIDSKKLVKGHIPSWSKLTATNQNNTKEYSYQQIAKAINEFFTDKEETPLVAEFHIWREIQFEIAAEAFYGQIINMNDNLTDSEKKGKKTTFKGSPIDEKKKYIKQYL